MEGLGRVGEADAGRSMARGLSSAARGVTNVQVGGGCAGGDRTRKAGEGRVEGAWSVARVLRKAVVWLLVLEQLE